jgi:hypothetical protein
MKMYTREQLEAHLKKMRELVREATHTVNDARGEAVFEDRPLEFQLLHTQCVGATDVLNRIVENIELALHDYRFAERLASGKIWKSQLEVEANKRLDQGIKTALLAKDQQVKLLIEGRDHDENDELRITPPGTIGTVSQVDDEGKASERYNIIFPNGAWLIFDRAEVGKEIEPV